MIFGIRWYLACFEIVNLTVSYPQLDLLRTTLGPENQLYVKFHKLKPCLIGWLLIPRTDNSTNFTSKLIIFNGI